jgi:hypothetical protein
VQVLYNPRSNQRGGRVGDPRYFPVTLAYSERMPCVVMNAWSATCVDQRSWSDIAIPLVPAVDNVEECGRIADSVLQDRCRQLNTYRAAFEHADTFDEVQRSLNICGTVGTDRIRQTCRSHVALYAVNQEPTTKEQAFIDHFLKAFPSTLRAGVITSP